MQLNLDFKILIFLACMFVLTACDQLKLEPDKVMPPSKCEESTHKKCNAEGDLGSFNWFLKSIEESQ